jgi:hypothetical protein
MSTGPLGGAKRWKRTVEDVRQMLSQYVEASASGICVSSRRTAFDAIMDARRRCSATRVACLVWLVVISLVGCSAG